MSTDNTDDLRGMASVRRTINGSGYKCSVSTLRNWAKSYHRHLSEHANPVDGGERKFTDKDLLVLLEVARLRDEKFTFMHIDKRLDDIAFPDSVDIPIEGYVLEAPAPEETLPAVVESAAVVKASELPPAPSVKLERVVANEVKTDFHSKWLVALSVLVLLLIIAVVALLVIVIGVGGV